MNINAQDYLAKLLAKENLTVQHGNYSTASFDVVDRTLKLPLWADKGKAVYDLLVGHEVGHALYTPAEGWHDAEDKIPGIPRAYINIIEDIRIEKKIQRTYPGIVRSFKLGYKRLFDDNIFGTEGKDISKYKFMDRLNIHSKGRGYAPVEFSEVEQRFVNLAMGVETWEDVLNACREINDFIKSKEDYDEDTKDTETVNEDPNGEPLDTTEDDSDSENTEGPSEEGDEEAPTSDTLTDDAQRDNESTLLDTDEAGRQSVYSSGLCDATIDHMIVSFEQLNQSRIERDSDLYRQPEATTHYKAFLKDTKATINLMVKDFERKKAAWEYSRSSEAKKGTLNVNKLHQYQYSEDIFLTVQQLAEAKSHGIFMLLDQSGSMQTIYLDVIKQAMIIALFCKRVNIPFEVHTYTSNNRYDDSACQDTSGNDIYDRNTKVVNVFNSSMKKAVLHEALKNAMAVALSVKYSRHYIGLDYHDVCEYDRFGSTPTVQALIVTETLLRRFKAKYPVQNVNLMVLTDGSADRVDVQNQYKHSTQIMTNDLLTFKLGNKLVTGENGYELFDNTLKAIKAITRVKITGFFLTNGRRGEFESGWNIFNLGQNNNHDKALSAFKKTGLTSIKNAGGFNDFFIIKTDAGISDDEFEVKENKNGAAIQIKDVKRQFRNFNKKKKQGKALVNKITDAIAISA